MKQYRHTAYYSVSRNKRRPFYTGWLKKSKLLSQYNSLLFWATLYAR